MRKTLSLALFSALLCSLVPRSAFAARALTQGEARAIITAVKAKIADPTTAHFVLGPWNGGQIYCGLVDTPDGGGVNSARHLFAVTFLPGGPGGISQAYLKGLTTVAGAPETTVTINICNHSGYKF